MYDNPFAIERLVALQQAQIARATERWRRQMDALEARPETGSSRPAHPIGRPWAVASFPVVRPRRRPSGVKRAGAKGAGALS